MNQSLVGAVIEARKIPSVERIYGAVHGIRGIVRQGFLDLTCETAHNLEMVGATPAAALGSTRDRPDSKYCEDILKVLRAHEIQAFFYTGGNDASDTLRMLRDQAQAANYPLTCVHIPNTIDNDLMVNDHTPGYPSAARFVALAFAGANLDNRSLSGVYLAVVMGRHSGFLTAAAALGRKHHDDGPHLIYVPERTFDLQQFAKEVKAAHLKHGRCLVAVSEGIHDASGEPIATRLAKSVERDGHGDAQLSGAGALAYLLTDYVKTATKITRVRGDTFGCLQRSFLGVVSDVDAREAREVGEKAVQFAHFGDANGNTSGSVTIHRVGSYAAEYQLSLLEDIAGKTKVMPQNFIHENGHDVTDKFVSYLLPLLGSGMPDVARLRLNIVPKIHVP